MIIIKTFVFNPFQENTYVISDSTKECIIIDAGNYSASETKQISEYIRTQELKPVMLVNTHGHIDHILGVENLKQEFSIPFALHGEDKFLVDSAPTHAAIYGFKIETTPVVDIDLSEKQDITFGETTMQIIHTPGHTPGHISLYHKEDKVLFTGDTLFKQSIGRTDLPGGDYSWIMNSIIDRLLPLGEDVAFYPGHGASSTIGYEILYNPFITEVISGEVNYKG